MVFFVNCVFVRAHSSTNQPLAIMYKIFVEYILLTVCDEIDRINREIYSLLNLVILLLVVVVGWPRDIVLARTLLAADHWLFIAVAVVIVLAVVVVVLLVRPFLLIIIVVLFFVL